MPKRDALADALKDLSVHPLPAKRFLALRNDGGSFAGLFRDCAFGEIYWLKTIGRPRDNPLSAAFEVDAGQDIPVSIGTPGGGPAIDTTMNEPHIPPLHDGKDDAEYWRVTFAVPGLSKGRHVHVTPKLRGKPWATAPGARAGIRSFVPPGASFIMPEGPVFLSFGLMSLPLLHFGANGILKP